MQKSAGAAACEGWDGMGGNEIRAHRRSWSYSTVEYGKSRFVLRAPCFVLRPASLLRLMGYDVVCGVLWRRGVVRSEMAEDIYSSLERVASGMTLGRFFRLKEERWMVGKVGES